MNNNNINNVLTMLKWRLNLNSFDDNKYFFNPSYSKYKIYEEKTLEYKQNKNIIDVYHNKTLYKRIIYNVDVIDDLLKYNDDKNICITNNNKTLMKQKLKQEKNFNTIFQCELFDISDFDVDLSKCSYFNTIIKLDKNKYSDIIPNLSVIENELFLKYFNIKDNEIIAVIPLTNINSICSYIKYTKY